MNTIGLYRILGKLYCLFFFIIALFVIPKRKINTFGGAPIIKFARWARALDKSGSPSKSIVPSIYKTNLKTDFDYVWTDFVPAIIKINWLRRIFAPGLAFIWMIRNASVVCAPVGGITFCNWFGMEFLEYLILKLKRIKTVIITGGGDAYMLGFINDKTLRVALQASYPERATMHKSIEKSVRFWEKRANVFVASQMLLDGFARNDLITPHMSCLESNNLTPSVKSNLHKKELLIIHAPNHRHFKGTDFILTTIDLLRANGYKFEFRLLENISNHEILEILEKTDIAIDQLIMPGYSNFAVECLSKGIPTLANVKSNYFYQIMTSYSFLEECPIVDVNIDNLYETLVKLINDDNYREKIAVTSKAYFNKRHSESSWINLWKHLESQNFDGLNISKNPYTARIFQRDKSFN